MPESSSQSTSTFTFEPTPAAQWGVENLPAAGRALASLVGQPFRSPFLTTLGNLTGALQNLSTAGATPTELETAGLGTLHSATDLSNLQKAYEGYYGAIAAPTILNNAIAAGLGQGAATEAQALAGAQAGTRLAEIQNQNVRALAQAQLGVGGQLPERQLRPLLGAGALAGTGVQAGLSEQQMKINALSNFINAVLGTRPVQTGATTTATGTTEEAPFLPSTLQGWTNLAGQIAGLFAPPSATSPGGALAWLPPQIKNAIQTFIDSGGGIPTFDSTGDFVPAWPPATAGGFY